MSRRDKHVIVANLWPRFYITFSVKKNLYLVFYHLHFVYSMLTLEWMINQCTDGLPSITGKIHLKSQVRNSPNFLFQI